MKQIINNDEWKKAEYCLKANCPKNTVTCFKQIKSSQQYGVRCKCYGKLTDYNNQLVVRIVFIDEEVIIDFWCINKQSMI